MHDLLTRIQEDFFVEMVWIILGFVLTSATLLGRWLYKKYQTKQTYKKISKLKPITEKDLNIISIGNAMPHYEKITVEHSNKKLFVDFPEELKEEIAKKVKKDIDPKKNPYIFHPDRSFNGQGNFNDIIAETGIANLGDLIEKHRRIVAQDFLEKKNGAYFNGKKYGVYSIDSHGRLGEEEASVLEICVFDTDYFTHKVFRSIYNELKQENHPISTVERENISKYKAFTTSLGINAYVFTDSPSGESILISRRSSAASETRGQKPYNSTIMEGLSQTDKDIQTGEISVEDCLFRGLYEELGVPLQFHKDNHTEVFFHDIFLERNFFEIGLTAKVKMNANYEQDIEPLVGQDKALEIDEIVPLPFKGPELNRFISNHTFMKQGLYTLSMVAIRKQIVLKQQKGR
ncbi:hypothetical protein [Bacillus sp. EB01]|uniref:hypothetical protein n=1 Tax=Bacillus sp. EB01 TaxID=1347086 RepID=UPI0006933A64|nr:hypothetical protein [Bacillus sp. EB01]